MESNKLYIGGEWVLPKSGKTFPTFNPATGEEIADIPLLGPWKAKKCMNPTPITFTQAHEIDRHCLSVSSIFDDNTGSRVG